MSGIGAFVVKEIPEILPPTLLFLFLFHMIGLTKAMLLEDYSISALRATTATIGALIVAKAILIVEALPMSGYFASNRVLHVIWKALLFAAVALIFRIAEEIVPNLFAHGELGAAVDAMLREISWPVFGVLMLWVFAALILYCVAAEIVSSVGAAKVKQHFLVPATGDCSR